MATVVECLASVATQSYLNREHIIIDGASDDGTRNILERHRKQLATLISEPDEGIYDALNKGLGCATGEVVGFLHADDLYANTMVLERVAEAFRDPEVSAVYGDLQYVRQDDKEHVVRYWRAGRYHQRKLGWGWMPPHPTLYVRREMYDRIGCFDTSYRIAADYLSILKLFSQPDLVTAYLPIVMVRMRLGGASNRSLRHVITKSREDYRALRQTGAGGLGTLLWKNVSKLGQFAGKAERGTERGTRT